MEKPFRHMPHGGPIQEARKMKADEVLHGLETIRDVGWVNHKRDTEIIEGAIEIVKYAILAYFGGVDNVSEDIKGGRGKP